LDERRKTETPCTSGKKEKSSTKKWGERRETFWAIGIWTVQQRNEVRKGLLEGGVFKKTGKRISRFRKTRHRRKRGGRVKTSRQSDAFQN